MHMVIIIFPLAQPKFPSARPGPAAPGNDSVYFALRKQHILPRLQHFVLFHSSYVYVMYSTSKRDRKMAELSCAHVFHSKGHLLQPSPPFFHPPALLCKLNWGEWREVATLRVRLHLRNNTHIQRCFQCTTIYYCTQTIAASNSNSTLGIFIANANCPHSWFPFFVNACAFVWCLHFVRLHLPKISIAPVHRIQVNSG